MCLSSTAKLQVRKPCRVLLLLLSLSAVLRMSSALVPVSSMPGIVNGVVTTTASSKSGGRRIATTIGSSSIETEVPHQNQKQEKQPKTAVVVGGGPGGLATALVLSRVRSPGSEVENDDFYFEKILVLDESLKENYDPTRAYFFNINRRGQRFTETFGIDLSGKGTAVTEFARQDVPSDPNEIFDGSKPFGRPMSEQERENMGTMYWIPRHELVQLLIDEIETKQQQQQPHESGATIEFRRGVRCRCVRPSEDGLVEVVLDSSFVETEIEPENVVADLCVGADGISSTVRGSLENGRFDPKLWENANNPSRKFGLKSYVTPSTGLRIKGLRVDPKFAIPMGGTIGTKDKNNNNDIDEVLVPIEPRFNYCLQSATNGPTDRFPLNILPQKNPESIASRPINICTEENHDIWDLAKIRVDDGGVSARAFFEKAHPRYDWEKLVAPEEWEIFSKIVGSRFPPCSYVPSMYVCTKPGPPRSDRESGVVLVGDALHSFPPDIGQGVNAAFSDAMALGKSFEKASSEAAASKPSTARFVASALRDYQASHGPETKALVELARCGAPFQYQQASMINRFKKTLWTANVALRMGLNKATLGWSPKPAILMSMDPSMSFLKIMRKANTLTAVLWSSLFLVAMSLLRARKVFGY